MTNRNSEANAKPTVITDRGECVEAVEPVIISASRSTDIPAFYSELLLSGKTFSNKIN